MENDWVIVFTTESPFQAELIHGMLKGNDIDSVIINKRDSSYGVFGDVSVYIHKENVEKARQLISETQGN
ncbi:MAG TPA: DUF2007 domain-containing protein [Chitinophagaceae bacterium]|jgi:hypothetical protein|nr:DUF2007 domain-containing protein [Chitinophagaceae bacterium]